MASGTVKWLDSHDSFGSHAPAHGARNMFAQISAPERAGFHQSDDGPAVASDVKASRDDRGPARNSAPALAFV